MPRSGGEKNSGWRRVLPCLILFFIAGCQNAAPPAPLAEVPTFLSFPNPEIDLTTISAGGVEALPVSFLVGPGGEFSAAIVEGPQTIAEVNGILNGLLAPLNEFEISVSPTVSNFAGTLSPSDAFATDYKFDFSPFDFDGDGVAESCTGCTCPTSCSIASCPENAPLDELKPVCYRVWIKRDPDGPFERLLAGVFDALPILNDPNTPEIEANPGIGRFRSGIQLPEGLDDPTKFIGLFFGVVYDHRDPTNPLDKSTELSAIDQGLFVPSYNLRSQIDQVGLGDGLNPLEVENSVKVSFEGTEFEFSPFSSNQYIGRYREDLDFWSGSLFSKVLDEVVENIEGVCARISTGNGVPNEICLDAGIDTSGESFLPPANLAEVEFPADFPASPTF